MTSGWYDEDNSLTEVFSSQLTLVYAKVKITKEYTFTSICFLANDHSDWGKIESQSSSIGIFMVALHYQKFKKYLSVHLFSCFKICLLSSLAHLFINLKLGLY